MMRRAAAAAGLCAGLLGVLLLAGCGGGGSSASEVPPGAVAVVDGSKITVSDLETTLRIAKLSLKTSYPVPGTSEWISLRERALEALAHDLELRAWARNLGVSVKAAAVDKAVKQTLASAFPGKTAGSVDQAKVDAEFRTTGMTRALLRHRIETKLMAQAAAAKVGGSPKVTDAQVEAQYEKDKKTVYAQPERRKVRHILVKTKALADEIYAQLESSDTEFAALARKYTTDNTKAKGGDLGVVNRNGLVKPFADVAFTLDDGRRLEADQDRVRLASDRGARARAAREHAPARRRPQDADPRPARREGAPEDDRSPLRCGGARARQGHPVRAGLRARDRGLAVTDGVAVAPPDLIVALGPGEPELVPGPALEALRSAGSAVPHELPAALQGVADRAAA